MRERRREEKEEEERSERESDVRLKVSGEE